MIEKNKNNAFRDATDYLERTDDSIANAAKEFNISRPNLTMFTKGYNYGMQKALALDETLSKNISSREANLYKNQYKNNLKSREINKGLREDALFELFAEEYVLPKIKPINVKKFTPLTPINDDRDIITFAMGDLHYVDKRRSERDILRLAELILDNYDGSKTIEIVVGGDWIENEGHRQQQIARTTTIMNQTIEVAELFSQVIATIKSNLPQVVINIVLIAGNHDMIKQLGLFSGEDNDTHVVGVIKKIIETHFKDNNDIVIIDTQNDHEYITNNFLYEHGQKIRGDLKNYFLTKKEQRNLKDITHYISFHSHRYEYIIPKGTHYHLIKSPCVKTWKSDWEIDNNQIGTPGILKIDSNNNIGFIPIGE